MKKFLSALLVLILTVSMLSGCGNKTAGTTEKKEKVRIALWGTQLLENYTQYLCDTFPDVEFEFTLATNSTDFTAIVTTMMICRIS